MLCDVWEEFRNKFADTFSRKQNRTVSPVTNHLYFLLCKSWQLPSVTQLDGIWYLHYLVYAI